MPVVVLCSVYHRQPRRSLTEKAIIAWAEVKRRQIDLRPVAFPPGLLNPSTDPAATGSRPTTKTIGTDVVATLAGARKGNSDASVEENASARTARLSGGDPARYVGINAAAYKAMNIRDDG